MVKRIIFATIIYIITVLFLVMKLNEVVSYNLILILISSLVFGLFIIREIYKNYTADFSPINKEIIYQESHFSESTTLKKISTRPFLFGLENKLLSRDEFYFDDDHFYAVNKAGQKATFNLTDITELGKTSVKINNRRLWQVKVMNEKGKIFTFKFAHNYTLWNNNFPLFYGKVCSINQDVVKTKWSIWNR